MSRTLEWAFVMGALSWVFARLWVRGRWRVRARTQADLPSTATTRALATAADPRRSACAILARGLLMAPRHSKNPWRAIETRSNLQRRSRERSFSCHPVESARRCLPSC